MMKLVKELNNKEIKSRKKVKCRRNGNPWKIAK